MKYVKIILINGMLPVVLAATITGGLFYMANKGSPRPAPPQATVLANQAIVKPCMWQFPPLWAWANLSAMTHMQVGQNAGKMYLTLYSWGTTMLMQEVDSDQATEYTNSINRRIDECRGFQ